MKYIITEKITHRSRNDAPREAAKRIRQLEPTIKRIYKSLFKEFDELFPHPDGNDSYYVYPSFSSRYKSNVPGEEMFAYHTPTTLRSKGAIRANIFTEYSNMHVDIRKHPFGAFLFLYLHELGHDFLISQGLAIPSGTNKSLRTAEKFCDEFAGVMTKFLLDDAAKENQPLLSKEEFEAMENQILITGSDINEYENAYLIDIAKTEESNKSKHPVAATRLTSFQRGFSTGNLRTPLEELGYINNSGKV